MYSNTELSKISLEKLIEETNEQNARAQKDGISRLMSLRAGKYLCPDLDLRKVATENPPKLEALSENESESLRES